MEREGKAVFIFNGKFLGYFLLYISLFFLIGQLPVSFLRNFKVFTAYAIAVFWRFFSFPVTYSDIYIGFLKFPMEITLECTALHYMTIFFAGVFAYPSHSFYYKIFGIFIGAISIFFLNILRIGILGIVAHYSVSFFDFVHAYLWQGTFALLVLLLWILWVNGRSAVSRIFVKTVFLSLIAAAVSFWVIIMFMNYYASVLAVMANAGFHFVSVVTGMHTTAIAEENVIGYVSQNGVIYNNISVDVINAVLFFTLATVTASFSQINVFLKRMLTGTGLLFLQHIAYVIMYGLILVQGMEPEKFAMLLWFTRGFSMVLPLLIWLFVTALFHPDSKP